MERKIIGETFEFAGATLEVVERDGCEGCYFNRCNGCNAYNVSVSCATSKPDGNPVIFKKVDGILKLLIKAHEELVRCGIESEIVDEIEKYLNKTK